MSGFSTDPDPLEAVKQRLMKLIGTREHSRSELERKLIQKGFPSALVREATAWAGREGYLDEQRFAAAYADELKRKGYGSRVVQKKLYQKGVRLEEPSEPEDPEAVQRQAADLVLRRFGEPDTLEPAIKLRAARFLLARGFDHGTIRGVLGPLPRG